MFQIPLHNTQNEDFGSVGYLICSKLKEVGIQEEEMKTDGMYFACSP